MQPPSAHTRQEVPVSVAGAVAGISLVTTQHDRAVWYRDASPEPCCASVSTRIWQLDIAAARRRLLRSLLGVAWAGTSERKSLAFLVAEADGGGRERARERRVSCGGFCCGVERRTDLDGHRRCFYPSFRSRYHRQSPKGRAVPRHLGKPFARKHDQLTFSLSCSAHSSASTPLSGALITPLHRIYCRDPT